MNIAVLFNSDHPTLGSCYGFPVMERILGANVLQTANRQMRVSLGDILTYDVAASSKNPTVSQLVTLCRMLYRPKELDLLIRGRLEATHGRATVFCWLFQNMTSEIARALHEKLSSDPAYLGAMDVDFSVPIHLQLFRNTLCEEFRLMGNRCSIFYHMGENEDPDLATQETLEQHGFEVDYEDIGARRTILDNYDTVDHFKRVEDFKRVFSRLRGLSSDQASDLALSLEELHPRLFDGFASVARTLERAETEEDLAQAAFSGRRLLERTADYLFPPRSGTRKGRTLSRDKYKNRLWAYLEEAMSDAGLNDPCLSKTLGKEIDRLVNIFNSGLHSNLTRNDLESAFHDLTIWLSEIIRLNPGYATKPYLAYEKELWDFTRRVTGQT